MQHRNQKNMTEWIKYLSDGTTETGPSFSEGRQDIVRALIKTRSISLEIDCPPQEQFPNWKLREHFVFSFNEKRSLPLYSRLEVPINGWKKFKLTRDKEKVFFHFDNKEGTEIPIEKTYIIFEIFENQIRLQAE